METRFIISKLYCSINITTTDKTTTTKRLESYTTTVTQTQL